MELRVFDKSITPLGIVDEAVSVIWQPTYWQQGEYGDVKILAPITDNNNLLLVKGNLIVLHGETAEYSDSRGEWRRAAQITYRNITKDENGTEQIEVQGCFLKKWLANRTIIKAHVISGTNQYIINTLVAENIGSSAEEKRRFEQWAQITQETIAGETVEYTTVFGTSLADAIRDRATASKIGYDILVNERAKLYGFYVYKGKDLTAGNTAGNKPCIFSRDFDNVDEQEYTESIENVKNVAYATSAADESNATYTIEVNGDDYSGIDRKETYIDASSISWKTENASGEEVTIPLDTYLQLMATMVDGQLEQQGETISFESTINTSQNLQYKRDFNVGDVITTIEKSWGIRIDARITKISETWQDGKQTIEATFGESLPTLLDQIKKAR